MVITTTIKNTLLLILLFFTINSYAQKRDYTATRLNGDIPRIDGIIDDKAWEHSNWTGEFTQTRPYENTAPSQQTKFKLLYDDNNLYIAIRAYDSSPDSIVKRMSRRDGFEGDWVKVYIDSYHDLLTGFAFTVNAAGVKSDEKITNDQYFDASWDPIWYVKTSIDNEGWIAEMRIPLTQLRFGKQDEYTWGLQVTRRIFRKDEYSCWQFISPNASGWVHHFGKLYGINNIVPKKQFDITPYVVGKIENYEKDEENPFADGRDYDGTIGLDGKVGITNDLTLDFTINPDFGQVEADPSEVNLTTFETFFPEKRAFFIEGNNILSHRILQGGGPLSSDNLFYSRRLGRQPGYWPDLGDNEYIKRPQNTTILGAFKLTGKTKKGLSVGIMESVTQKETAEIATLQTISGEKNYDYRKQTVEPLTNYFASRFEQDLNNSNTQIGAMVTATNRELLSTELKESMHASAYTAGVNFNHNWKEKTYYFRLNGVASHIRGTQEAILNTQTNPPHFFQRPDAAHLKVDSVATTINGYGGTVQIGKNGQGKWRFTNWITFRSPGLDLNEMGYMRQNDEIQQVFWLSFVQNDPKSFYRDYRIDFNQWYGSTFEIKYKYFGGNTNAHLQFKNHWRIGAGVTREGKFISPNHLRGGPSLLFNNYSDYWIYGETDNRRKIHFKLNFWNGLRDVGTFDEKNLSLQINTQISDAFKLSFEPGVFTSLNKIEYVNTIEGLPDMRYICGTINRIETSLTVRFTYNITPDFTIQYYGMPFVSAGKYSDFKYIDNPQAPDFNERAVLYNNGQIFYNETDEVYYIDENENGEADYSFENPDFNVLDFNSNLVIRWEYLPGSTVYLVWTQKRSKYDSNGTYSFNKDNRNLFMNTYPHDILLLKFSYRFGLR